MRGILSVFLAVAACSPSPSTHEVSVTIPGIQNSRSGSQLVSSIGGPPASSSGFNCLFVNVIGDGISKKFGSTGTEVLDALKSGASYCTYPGILAGPISNTAGGTVNMVVSIGEINALLGKFG